MTDNVCYHCEDCTAQIIPDCGRCGYTCDQCECDQCGAGKKKEVEESDGRTKMVAYAVCGWCPITTEEG